MYAKQIHSWELSCCDWSVKKRQVISIISSSCVEAERTEKRRVCTAVAMNCHYYCRPQQYRRNAFEHTRGHNDNSLPFSCRMHSEKFSPRDKVRDMYHLHPKPGVTQETPMKPSQLQNRCPPLLPPPKRPLPFNSPELNHQDHWHPPRPPRRHSEPYHQSHGSVRRRDGENHRYQRTRSQVSSRAAHRRPGSPHRQNSHSSHYQDRTGHNIRDQREKDRGVSSSEQRGHLGQDAYKRNIDNSGHVVLLTPLVKLSQPLVRPLLNASGRETVPLQRSDSWTPSSKSSTSTQNQPRPVTLTKGSSHTNGAHHLQQKRCRESDSDDDHFKKQCLQPPGPNGTLQCSTANGVSPLYSSQKHLSPKTSNDHSLTESAHLNVVTPVLSSSHHLKSCLKRTSVGAKQACIESMENNLVFLVSPSKRSEVLANSNEESMNKCKRVSFSFPNMLNDFKSSSRVPDTVDNKTVDSVNQKPIVKQSTNPPSCRKLHRNKKPVIDDDIHDLFTPDPTTYIVNSGHKTLKVWPDQTKAVTDKSSSSTSVSSNPQTPAPELCQEEKMTATATDVPDVKFNLPDHIKISLPNIILTRIPLPIVNTGTKCVDEQEDVEKDLATSESTAVSPSRTDEQSEETGDEDSLDLDLELDFDMDLEVASISSSDSEDVELVSLQEIMTKKDKAEKEALSETKHHHSTTSSTKPAKYKNSLDQILKDLAASRKAKETETELLAACQEDMLRIAEYEEAQSREESITAEHQMFLQRYSLSSSAIREVPPGHEVFHFEMFGRIFNQDTLQLRDSSISPQNTAQKMLLWSSHAQFKLHINCGLVQQAYDHSPCPFRMTCFLFKMMSVHSDALLSDKILEALKEIALNAAVQRVNKGNKAFKVWVPSLEDITLVLMNMGAPFVTLFPLKSLRPPFTESDLLVSSELIKSDSHSNKEPRRFPEHSCTNIFKYLNHCLALCPRFYSDEELLLLLTLLCTVSLDSRLLLHSRVYLYPVLGRLLKNIRRWDNMIPKMCQALTDLTDHHHNLCHLVQLLPHHSRGMQLRQHLSLSMISKLLDGSCSYIPRARELQLCDLRPYLSRLKPSCLLRTVMAASHQSHTEEEVEEEEDTTTPDQQAYYLSYSLLTLVNESTNFQVFPAHQKEQLLFLCSELERHVKCHIREGERWLYRSKVKDLVARVYTKWQMMLQKTRPLNGQLYDYWQPLQEDIGSSQDIEEIEPSQECTKTATDDDNEAEADVKAEEEEEVTDLTQSEDGEKAWTFKENGLSNAAEEAKRQEEKDKDGALDQAGRSGSSVLGVRDRTSSKEDSSIDLT